MRAGQRHHQIHCPPGGAVTTDHHHRAGPELFEWFEHAFVPGRGHRAALGTGHRRSRQQTFDIGVEQRGDVVDFGRSGQHGSSLVPRGFLQVSGGAMGDWQGGGGRHSGAISTDDNAASRRSNAGDRKRTFDSRIS